MTESRSGASRSQKSILLAHPHKLIWELMAGMLSEANFRVMEPVNTMGGLKRAAAQHTPDIILLAGTLPETGTEAIESLTQEHPRSSVVVVGNPESPEAVVTNMRAGAAGYLSINLSIEEFLTSVRMIAQGDVIISRELADLLTKELSASSNEEQPIQVLSEREREVLSLIGVGATNKEIAEKLVITENTVKVHLRNILDKLDLRNRQQAAAFAAQEGLVEEVRIEMAELENSAS